MDSLSSKDVFTLSNLSKVGSIDAIKHMTIRDRIPGNFCSHESITLLEEIFAGNFLSAKISSNKVI